MLEKPTALYQPVLLIILSILLITASYYMVGWRQVVLGVIGVVLFFVSLVLFGDWIWNRFIWHYRAIVDMKSRTPQVRVMEQIASMSPEQISYASSLQTVINMLPGEPAPIVWTVTIGNISIPVDFIRMFMRLSTETNLASERQWSDGSMNRKYAVALTNHLISMGYAWPASGNRSATWVDQDRRQLAQQSLGLILPGGDENQLVTMNFLENWLAKRSRQRKEEEELRMSMEGEI